MHPVKYFPGLRMAVTVAQGSKKAYTASSRHRYRAEAEALKQCRDAGEPQCKIIVPEGCSLPYL